MTKTMNVRKKGEKRQSGTSKGTWIRPSLTSSAFRPLGVGEGGDDILDLAMRGMNVRLDGLGSFDAGVIDSK